MKKSFLTFFLITPLLFSQDDESNASDGSIEDVVVIGTLASIISAIEKTYERNIDINNVFNKAGVCRVIAQIILSIFSLNTKESGALNDVGKIEAIRAASAYLESWIKK